ncbi:hypothetical protein FACS1894216_14250 [Synergistales bacterium]|nr:hypothetical protein FACS1894216_14250 [Synergistales bacterium]
MIFNMSDIPDDALRQWLEALQKENTKLSRQLTRLQNTLDRNKAAAATTASVNAMRAFEQRKRDLYMQMLLENSPDIILLLDREGRFSYCTRAFLERARIAGFGLIEGRLLNEVFYRFAEKSWVDELFARFQTAMRNKEQLSFEEAVDISGDGARDYSVHFTPVCDGDGSFDCSVVMFHDITELRGEKKKAEDARDAAEYANMAKSQFLSNMSHEIRTPMNAIIGMSELALRENVSPAVGEYILQIKAAGTNLLSIINDILDFSKIESGKIEIAREPYLFASLINDVVNLIRVRIAEKPILFIVNIDPNIPNCLVGDEVRVRQVLTNLLSNACKYTNEGFIKMTIGADFTARDRAVFKFEIEDSGIGIKQEDIGQLFKKFARVDINKNKNVVGTGLGLSIAQSFCRMMGGDVTVSSEYGKGSLFTATFEQEYSDGEKFASVQDAENKRVLLYEKIPLYADSLEYTLSGFGVNLTRPRLEIEFLEQLAGGKYDFAFFSGEIAGPTAKLAESARIKTELVALLEVGESLPDWNGGIILPPAFAISVANVLNGVVTDVFHGDYEIRFIAPSANVLVVDDIDANLKVAEGLFAPYQMNVTTCLSGAEAVELVRKNEYDIVFMDHMMPDMDGIEATEAIRALDGEYFKELPIIALTANAMVGMREMFTSKGLNDYLAKPIELHKLNEIMERWIPKRKQFKAGEVALAAPDECLLPHIYGTDIERGIAMTGGREANYINILKLFSKDARGRIEVMRGVPLNEGTDLTLFSANAHALKGTAASIGASAVSGMAKEIEFAGKQGDTEAIRAKLGGFLDELAKLVASIDSALKQLPAAEPGAERDFITEKISADDLLALKGAIERDDVFTTDALFAKFKQMNLSEADKKTLGDIEDNVLISETESAVKGIDELGKG